MRLPVHLSIQTPKLLYRWHPDDGYYSLVREDDDDDAAECDDYLYE